MCMATPCCSISFSGAIVSTMSKSTLVTKMENDVYSPNSLESEQIAPGRRIENRLHVLLPSGATREFYEDVITCLEPPMTYVTHREMGVRPGYDCSCQPMGPQDISECSNPKCLAVTCLAHSDTCPFCGQAYCTGCLTTTYHLGFESLICRLCDKDLRTPKIIKTLKKIIWG
jgi:hypothetical protein